jgi:hypothetical protein
LRFHSLPSKASSSSNLTTEVEEISAPSDSFSSPEEEEEEEDTSSQHHHGGAEEEFIFSSVPTLMVQLNKGRIGYPDILSWIILFGIITSLYRKEQWKFPHRRI